MCILAFFGIFACYQELHSETLVLLGEVENWSELDWPGLRAVQDKLPPIREKVRDMSHCLSDCWTQLDNTQRLLSTLTEVKHKQIHTSFYCMIVCDNIFIFYCLFNGRYNSTVSNRQDHFILLWYGVMQKQRANVDVREDMFKCFNYGLSFQKLESCFIVFV